MIYQINSIALSRLSNAAHVAFMSNIKSEIYKLDLESSGIDEKLYNEFKEALKKEQDCVNRARASMFTQRMKEADEKRDNCLRRLHYRLRLVQCEPDQPLVTPFVIDIINQQILAQYPLSICNARAQDETAKIRGLIYDLKAKIGALLETLQLDKEIKALEDANDEFEDFYLERVAERSASVETSAYRSATEDLYQKICLNICFLANMKPATDLDMLHNDVCKDLVSTFNQLIKEFRQKIGLTPDPSLESEGSEMLNDSEEVNSEPISE